LQAVENLTGKKFPEHVFTQVSHGADEEDLVNSGLEETMISAYNQMNEIRKQQGGKIDLRTAAFISAIDKVARTYMELGIFP
jgi:glutamate dehydrogenase (NAD(P)+)